MMLAGLLQLENSNFEGVQCRNLMLSVVMLMGLLQQRNSIFEGVVRRKFVEVGYRFPSVRFSPVKQI